MHDTYFNITIYILSPRVFWPPVSVQSILHYREIRETLKALVKHTATNASASSVYSIVKACKRSAIIEQL